MGTREVLTLKDRIAAARRVGRVDIGQAARGSDSPVQAADAAALAAGAIAIGAAWTAIDQDQARAIIRKLLTRDLAYNSRCMPDTQAAALSDEILGLVPASTHFFTSLGMDVWFGLRDGVAVKTQSFNAVTEATFSAAVAIVGIDQTTVLVISDED